MRTAAIAHIFDEYSQTWSQGSQELIDAIERGIESFRPVISGKSLSTLLERVRNALSDMLGFDENAGSFSADAELSFT